MRGGSTPRVGYVTDGFGQQHDDEYLPVAAALGRRGIAAEAVRWDDPGVDWAAFDLAVVRSTWDYVRRRGQFVDWAACAGADTLLANPAEVLADNTDKTYLRRLAEQGVPVVPTAWFAPGESAGPADLDGVHAGAAELVVKPAVSAGAADTTRTDDRARAARAVADVQASGRTAMVQPYLPGVETHGETSLLYLGGELSHAVRRAAALAGDYSQVPAERPEYARTPEPVQRDLAERALAALGGADGLLYARVDVVPLPDDGWGVIEVELTEPYLFLRLAGDDPKVGPDRLATAVERWLRRA